MNKNDFTSGKIFQPLIVFAFPVLCASLLQTMYGAVDLLIVGQFGTSADVSAVSNGSQLLQLITAIVIGLSMGTTVLIGQKIGEKRHDQAGDVVGTAIIIFSVLALIISIGVICLAKPMVTLMNTPPEAFDQTCQYIVICAIGFIFITAYNVLCGIFRGIGDSKTPLLAVFIACIVNVLGDLLFVAVFGMNTMGAALATVLAQATSVILSIVVIKKRGLPFPFSKANIKLKKEFAFKIITTGAPIALQDVLVNTSFLFIGSITNTLGVVASAGVGVARKLTGMIMLVPIAFAQAMAVFTAQNVGAMEYKRANKALQYAIGTSISISVVIAYFSFFHGSHLAHIFTSDAAVTVAAAEYMKAYALDVLLTAFTFCLIGYLNGHGKTTWVMAQGLMGALGIRIPVSYLMAHSADPTLFKIGLAIPISTFIQLITLVILFVVLNVKLNKDVEYDCVSQEL